METTVLEGAVTTQPDWKASLPEEFRSLPTLEKFKGIGDVVKSYTELEKLSGSAIKMPKGDAPQEEYDKFYSKLGRPESPDKYELKRPEMTNGAAYDEDLEKAARVMFHGAGLQPRQAQLLLDGYTKLQADRLTAYNKSMEEGVAALKKDLGSEYDSRVQACQDVIKEFGDEGTKNFLNETNFGNHPEAIKIFSNIAKFIAKNRSEDVLIVGDGASEAGSADTLEVAIDQSTNDPKHPYKNPDAPYKARMAAAEQVLKMRERLELLRRAQ